MGIEHVIKNQRSLTISAAIIIITVVFVYLWISGIFLPTGSPSADNSTVSSTPELTLINSSLKQFPPEIQAEIQILADAYSIAPDSWGFDAVNNEIDLFAGNIHNASAARDLQGKKIGNYTIHIFDNAELETSKEEVRAYLQDLKKKPEYQIDNFGMVSSAKGPYAEVWCTSLTPENKKLDNTVMKGWKILVYPISPLPSDTKNPSGTIAAK